MGSCNVSTGYDLTPRSPRRPGPAGKVRKLFEEVSKLPRLQQYQIAEFLSPIVEDYKEKRTG